MRKFLYYTGILFLGAVCLLNACRKDSGFYKAEASVKVFSGSTYDFLKSQVGVYDSFLYVMDRLNLTDSLKTGNYTVFAPTNPSFERAIADVNRLRKEQKRPLQYLANIPYNELDSLACRYIIEGVIPADSMRTQDGIFFHAIRYNYMMHGKTEVTNAEGYVEGGPQIIRFADTKGVIYTRQWSIANTVTINIKTTNGIVNVLDRNHVFGFDEFIPRVNPTNSTPYFEKPMTIPGTIGFVYYDKGGERVGYHDYEEHNYGTHGFRTSEGVDIGVGHNGDRGYLVGWTNPGEWMNYTVDIADTGYYKVIIRAASPEDDASLHFLWDNKRLNNNIKIEGTGNTDTYANNEAIIGPLPKGRHVLTVWLDYSGYDLRWMKFVPYNKPFPVPGTIPAVDFNEGGEGVAYHDADGGNGGGQYRPDEGVDIEQNSQKTGGYNVGWTNGGEWLNYTIDVKETGDYVVAVNVASGDDPNGGHRFHVSFDDVNLTGTMVCPNTGTWFNWTAVEAIVHLEKGEHIMQFYEETGGYNFRSITISPLH